MGRNFELLALLIINPRNAYLVRFIRSNRALDIFGEKYNLPVEYEYVMAIIDNASEKLKLYVDSNLVKKFSYSCQNPLLSFQKLIYNFTLHIYI